MRRAIGVVALVVLSGAVLGLAIAVAPSQANVPGKNGLILFQRLVGTPSKTCDPCTHVFTIRADGSGLRQLTRGRPFAASPAWAPDGKRVVMEHGKGLGLLDLRSGKIRQLTNHANLWPSFSPDGKSIVFWQSTASHGESLWIVDANGRHPRYVAHGDGGIYPVFSPDGSQIAMARKGALFVVKVDGSGRTPLVRQSFGAAGKVDWSPDGSRIFFHDQRDRLFTIGPDGTGLTQLARGKRLCSESFSPDGTKLLALGNCESDTDSYLLMMNLDGTGLKRIPNTKGAHWASWGTQR
jgi:Tol biopolymer transport system component